MKYLAVLLLNILFCIILLIHPKSEIYHGWEMTPTQVVDHYTSNISADTDSYANMPDKDMLRTIGYPILLKMFMQSNHFLILILLLNCLLGAWMFFVVFQLIGAKAWILAVLGAFTAYVPILYTDLLFAALFVTSIWMIRKNIWIHFLLLGVAALVRPSLAWFFLIEPIVLYYYGQKRVLWSLPIVFILTSFNPIRNYINHGVWTHSTVLQFNIKSGDYYGGTESVKYFIKAFMANDLSGHYDYIGAMFNSYKRDLGDKKYSLVMYVSNILCVIINMMIWVRFGVKAALARVNFGNLMIAIYFIIPTLFGAAGARLRLPIEWILLI